ncbi:MAG: SMC-Scp complex subunit ScpB [archaeon]
MGENDSIKKVEAALFVAGRFLSIDEIVMLTGVNPLSVKELLSKLLVKYEASDSSINIVNKNDLWKMDVKPEYAEIMTKLASGKAEFTRAEQETLAVIAYKQPIKQSVIVKIRGNKAYEHIKRFSDMGLLKCRKVSHTIELQLSEEFYNYFQVGVKEEEAVKENNENSQK